MSPTAFAEIDVAGSRRLTDRRLEHVTPEALVVDVLVLGHGMLHRVGTRICLADGDNSSDPVPASALHSAATDWRPNPTAVAATTSRSTPNGSRAFLLPPFGGTFAPRRPQRSAPRHGSARWPSSSRPLRTREARPTLRENVEHLEAL